MRRNRPTHALRDPAGSAEAPARRRPTPHGLAPHFHALSGQLAAAVRNADWAGSRGELRASAAEITLPPALRSSSALRHAARQHLHPRSVAFRHAVRTRRVPEHRRC